MAMRDRAPVTAIHPTARDGIWARLEDVRSRMARERLREFARNNGLRIPDEVEAAWRIPQRWNV